MSIDQQQLAEFRKTMEADDYHLTVDVSDDAATATIAAGPDACDECLVPKDFMRHMLSPILGVEAARIDITYPTEVAAAG